MRILKRNGMECESCGSIFWAGEEGYDNGGLLIFRINQSVHGEPNALISKGGNFSICSSCLKQLEEDMKKIIRNKKILETFW